MEGKDLAQRLCVTVEQLGIQRKGLKFVSIIHQQLKMDSVDIRLAVTDAIYELINQRFEVKCWKRALDI